MTIARRTGVLVIGIDAANPKLLIEWAAQGILPNIAALLRDGLVAASESLAGFTVGSTWPSLYTGLSPARHGFHYLVQLKSGTYELERRSEAGFVRGEPFWTALSRAGRRVAILDVPLSRLDPSLNGIQVVEWGGHDAVFGFQAWPAELEDRISARFGAHPAGTQCDAVRRTAPEYECLVAALERGAHAKAALTVDLLRARDWDLLMQVFTESHCAGHQCWHLSDPNHPAHDASIRSAIGDPLQRVYGAIDAAIGSVLAEAGEPLTLLVVAHGMSYRFGANFLLRDILIRLGVTTPLPTQTSLLDRIAPLWHRLPRGAQRRLRPLRKRLRHDAAAASPLPRLDTDPRSSRCFPVHNGLAAGGIRINLRGREPHGLVDPGSAADAFCDALADDLLAIIDERTGRPLVRRVLRTKAHYQGENAHELPDLVVEWSDEVHTGSATVGNGEGAVVRVHSKKIGTLQGINDYGRSGEHRPEGLLVAKGRGIAPGRLERAISVLDFAPTVSALCDVALADRDGRVLTEFLPRHPS